MLVHKTNRFFNLILGLQCTELLGESADFSGSYLELKVITKHDLQPWLACQAALCFSLCVLFITLGSYTNAFYKLRLIKN